MKYQVWCQTCNKEADRAVKDRDALRRVDVLLVWCHGRYAEITASDENLIEAVGSDVQEIRISAFAKPIPIVIDRDRGDEDPNEPWQGDTCQM